MATNIYKLLHHFLEQHGSSSYATLPADVQACIERSEKSLFEAHRIPKILYTSYSDGTMLTETTAETLAGRQWNASGEEEQSRRREEKERFVLGVAVDLVKPKARGDNVMDINPQTELGRDAGEELAEGGSGDTDQTQLSNGASGDLNEGRVHEKF